MDIQFVTSVAPIMRDADVSRSFYTESLGLRLRAERATTCSRTSWKDKTLWTLASIRGGECLFWNHRMAG